MEDPAVCEVSLEDPMVCEVSREDPAVCRVSLEDPAVCQVFGEDPAKPSEEVGEEIEVGRILKRFLKYWNSGS